MNWRLAAVTSKALDASQAVAADAAPRRNCKGLQTLMRFLMTVFAVYA